MRARERDVRHWGEPQSRCGRRGLVIQAFRGGVRQPRLRRVLSRGGAGGWPGTLGAVGPAGSHLAPLSSQCAFFFFKAISLRNTECGSSCLAIVNRFLCSLDRGNYSRTEFERCRPKERTCRSFFRSPIFERCERLRYYNSCGDTPAVLKKVTERSSTGVWTERRAFRVVSGSIFG